MQREPVHQMGSCQAVMLCLVQCNTSRSCQDAGPSEAHLCALSIPHGKYAGFFADSFDRRSIYHCAALLPMEDDGGRGGRERRISKEELVFPTLLVIQN